MCRWRPVTRHDQKLLDAQMTSWAQDLVCIANLIPRSRTQPVLAREKAVSHFAEPGSWPIKDVARLVGTRPSLSREAVAAAEEVTERFLEAYTQSRTSSGPESVATMRDAA